MQIKGLSTKDRTEKTKRPIKFKVRVFQLKDQLGHTGRQALRIACEEFDLPLAPAMNDHPGSFVDAYIKTIIHKLHLSDAETIKACEEAGIELEDEPEPKEGEAASPEQAAVAEFEQV